MHKALQYHSPLEGESARGRSPQSSRWGANATSRESISAVRQAAPEPLVPLRGSSCPFVDFFFGRRGPASTPHRISLRLAGSASATPPQGGSDNQHREAAPEPFVALPFVDIFFCPSCPVDPLLTVPGFLRWPGPVGLRIPDRESPEPDSRWPYPGMLPAWR